MSVRQKLHDLERVKVILQVAGKYGFGAIVDRLNLEHRILGRRIIGRRSAAIAEEPPGVRFRQMLEELGPTFIKLGQILSMRSDILPPEYIQELSRLQDDVPPFDPDAAREVVVRELDQPLTAVFRSFFREPKASASLAQVHEARLLSGQEVVVKIQRPHIEETINADLEILFELARLAYRHIPEARVFDPPALVSEFKTTILREIDFINEASNIERFQQQFIRDPAVHIPAVYRAFSTRRLLVMEDVHGIKITDLEALRRTHLDPKQIAVNGANAVIKQIFDFGFFHADPHPGNILVRPGNQVVLLDFGMVGRLSETLKTKLFDALTAVIDRDIPAIRDAFLAIGTAEGDIDTAVLDRQLESLVIRFYDLPLKEINAGQLLMGIIRILTRHRIRLPADLFLLSKVLITIDGIGKMLDKDFNMVEQTRPFVRDLERRRYRPEALARETRKFLFTAARFVQNLPRDMGAILAKLKKGTLEVEFEHKGLEDFTAHIDKASSRISLAVIIAALLVGSSLLIQSNVGPRFHDYPIFGLVIFVVAAVLGLWLIIVIVSSGRI